MLKKVFLILLLMLFILLTMVGCGDRFISPTTPDIPDPWQYGGEIEIMYERVFGVVNPNIDITENAASVYHLKYGWLTSSYWIPAGENKWTASIFLNCDAQPYFLVVEDYQVSNEFIAEKVFLRRKGDSVWIGATCIVDDWIGGAEGKATKFIFNNGQIQIPNTSSI